MPLVINAFGGGHTHRQTHTHTNVQTKAISRNQARGLRLLAPGLKTFYITYHGSSYSQYEYIPQYDITYIAYIKLKKDQRIGIEVKSPMYRAFIIICMVSSKYFEETIQITYLNL